MMWDLNGVGYAPSDSPPVQGYPIPSQHQQAPAPFMPIGAPLPQFPSPSTSRYAAGPGSPWSLASTGYTSISTRALPPTAPQSSMVMKRVHYHQSSRTTYAGHKHTSNKLPKAYPHPALATQKVSTSHVRHHEPSCSKCTGRRKALCIGINYRAQPHELRGCVNDAKNVYRFLIHHYNYKPEDVMLLVDDDPQHLPTRSNILKAMHWLVRSARPDDALFFHYSGHGGQVKDQNGDEQDGYDEVIFPLDYSTSRTGYITDDDMNDILVQSLPPGCRLTALFDSCHSGSMLDVPYLYLPNGRVKGSQVTDQFFKKKASDADVIVFSACKDSQKSADAWEAGAAAGAMSYAFMTCLRQNPKQSFQELLGSIRDILRKKYSQTPQLSSSRRIDTGRQFIM